MIFTFWSIVYYADKSVENKLLIKQTSKLLIVAFLIIFGWISYWMIQFNKQFNARIERLKKLTLKVNNIILMYDEYFDYDYEQVKPRCEPINRFTSGSKMTRILIRLIEDNKEFEKDIQKKHE